MYVQCQLLACVCIDACLSFILSISTKIASYVSITMGEKKHVSTTINYTFRKVLKFMVNGATKMIIIN